MQVQQKHVQDIVGVPGVDWEWHEPTWAASKVNAGESHATELNAGRPEVSDNDPFFHLSPGSQGVGVLLGEQTPVPIDLLLLV